MYNRYVDDGAGSAYASLSPEERRAIMADLNTANERVKMLERQLEVDGVFVSIGRKPATKLFEGLVPLDGGGYIIAGEDTKTAVSGVYAVGDVRTKAVRQVVTAAADGAVAAMAACSYLDM